MSDGLNPRYTWERAVLDSDLKTPAKMICLSIATYMSKSDGRAFPGIPRLASDTGMGRSTVIRYLTALTEQGAKCWLEKVAKFDPNTGRQTRNEYTPMIPEGRVPERDPRGSQSGTGEGPRAGPEQTIRNRPEEQSNYSAEISDCPSDWTPEMCDVFTYWRNERATVVGAIRGPKMKPTPKRGSKIRSRLGEEYTVQALKQAIRGCLSNPYNVEGGYLDIELICRDQAHVEQYLAWARNGNGAQPRLVSGRGAIDAIERGGKNA